MAELSFALAEAFQAEALAALGAGDLDRAGRAETRFSRLALDIRRALALKARLREQREAARRVDAQGREARQAEIAGLPLDGKTPAVEIHRHEAGTWNRLRLAACVRHQG